MKTKDYGIIFLILVISLFNYKLAKLLQEILSTYLPNFSYYFLLSFVWFLVAILPFLLIGLNQTGLKFDYKKIIANKRKLFFYSLLVVLGLMLFVVFGITKYFHLVKNPFIFFFVTPIIEEIIFRGSVYAVFDKFKKLDPILISSILFGLHHLQYFNFLLTKFAIFQIAYTFILGLFLGKTRKLSGSIYIGLGLHILINFVTVYF